MQTPTMPHIPELAAVLEGADHIDVKIVTGAVPLRAFLAAGVSTRVADGFLSYPRRFCTHARHAARWDATRPADDAGHRPNARG